MAILYISPSFGIFFLVLVCCTQKNLATLLQTHLRTFRTFLFVFQASEELEDRESLAAMAASGQVPDTPQAAYIRQSK
jgi:hypothetical protein